jgi:hypothetical protein
MAFIKDGLGPLPGNAIHGQAVIILEALHGTPCLISIGAIHSTCQITQFCKTPLKLFYSIAAGSHRKCLVFR